MPALSTPSSSPASPDQRKFLLSGHQPVYLPGIILFNKIALSDAFMFVGHCQFVKKSWHSRNRIQLNQQELWLTVPVKTAGLFEQSIDSTAIIDQVWKRKHLGSIRQAYGKAPFFDLYYPDLEAGINAPHATLGDLNISLIVMFLRCLEISTPILYSRHYEIQGNKTQMLISMCRAVGATGYLSNEGSRTYVDEQEMEAAGLQHFWQTFEHPVYEQGKTFMPNLSIIDVLFHVGPAAREVVLNCGHVAPGERAQKMTA